MKRSEALFLIERTSDCLSLPGRYAECLIGQSILFRPD